MGNISFETPKQLKHGVETYGLNIRGKNSTISLITDTDYFTELASFFTGDILIVNVVMLEDRSTIEHLCLNEAELIIKDKQTTTCDSYTFWDGYGQSKTLGDSRTPYTEAGCPGSSSPRWYAD